MQMDDILTCSWSIFWYMGRCP